MPEPSLALLQTLMERMLDQQGLVLNRLERVERALLAVQRLLPAQADTDAGANHDL